MLLACLTTRATEAANGWVCNRPHWDTPRGLTLEALVRDVDDAPAIDRGVAGNQYRWCRLFRI
ncbi:MAG: hypothetical protein ACYTGL_25320 [Planctomycetota bacterium]